jgi:hypothetical protein
MHTKEMEHRIQGNGMKINNMDLELKNGLMELVLKAIILWDKKWDKEFFNGLTEAVIKVNFKIIIFKAKDLIGNL